MINTFAVLKYSEYKISCVYLGHIYRMTLKSGRWYLVKADSMDFSMKRVTFSYLDTKSDCPSVAVGDIADLELVS